MEILRGHKKIKGKDKIYKELLIGYKNIFINAYVIRVIDLSSENTPNNTIYRHESFHLWEAPI